MEILGIPVNWNTAWIALAIYTGGSLTGAWEKNALTSAWLVLKRLLK